jgi:hypothetical protein
MRASPRRLLALAAFLLAGNAPEGIAQSRIVHTLRGNVRDSTSGLPLFGAVVELRGADVVFSQRTDDDGMFRFPRLTGGAYRVSILRIGYVERVETFTLARDTLLALEMMPVAQRLSGTRIVAEEPAIFGAIGIYPDLDAAVGAKVQVIGAYATATVDSSGRFFLPLSKGGRYMVRVTRDGLSELVFSVDVPPNRAIEASQLLERGIDVSGSRFDGVYADMDSRLRGRGLHSAFVAGSELRRVGGSLIDALRGSPGFFSRSLRLSERTCVYLNGLPRPGLSLTSFRVEEIEAIELYGSGATIDDMNTRSIEGPNAWRGGCGENGIVDHSPQGQWVGGVWRPNPEIVSVAYIWTRR